MCREIPPRRAGAQRSRQDECTWSTVSLSSLLVFTLSAFFFWRASEVLPAWEQDARSRLCFERVPATTDQCMVVCCVCVLFVRSASGRDPIVTRNESIRRPINPLLWATFFFFTATYSSMRTPCFCTLFPTAGVAHSSWNDRHVWKQLKIKREMFVYFCFSRVLSLRVFRIRCALPFSTKSSIVFVAQNDSQAGQSRQGMVLGIFRTTRQLVRILFFLTLLVFHKDCGIDTAFTMVSSLHAYRKPSSAIERSCHVPSLSIHAQGLVALSSFDVLLHRRVPVQRIVHVIGSTHPRGTVSEDMDNLWSTNVRQPVGWSSIHIVSIHLTIPSDLVAWISTPHP